MADFLIFDPLFPRSVCCCLRECEEAAHAISGRPPGECGNEAERLSGSCPAGSPPPASTRPPRAGLHESLTRVVNSIHDVGEAVDRAYFDVGPQTPPAPAACAAEGAVSMRGAV